ncbi:MAG: TlpA family protein disulfide reductase [Bdellovibrionales bacterium]
MKPYLKPLLVLLPIVLIVVGYAAWRLQSGAEVQEPSAPTEDAVSKFSLQELRDWQGREIPLDQLTKSNLVFHFWAAWCAPCIHEFPDLIEMSQREQGRTVVIAVSEDKDMKEIEVFLKSFPQALKAPHFFIVWDQDRSLMQRWQVEKLPESFIYSPNRTLAKRVTGAVTWTNEDAKTFFEKLHQTDSPN